MIMCSVWLATGDDDIKKREDLKSFSFSIESWSLFSEAATRRRPVFLKICRALLGGLFVHDTFGHNQRQTYRGLAAHSSSYRGWLKFSAGGIIVENKSFASFISVGLILYSSGCTHRPADQSMSGWDHMMGYGGYGGMFMWLILIVIAGVIIYFFINRGKANSNSINATRESPTDILKKRYAKGEITKEEFDRLKSEIEK